MPKLSKLDRFLKWCGRQSIARLFGYTRNLENQLDRLRSDIWTFADKQEEKIQALEARLIKERIEFNKEREALLDRMLVKNSFAPIHTEQKPQPPKQVFKPPHELAVEEAMEQHKQFNTLLDAAMDWKKGRE